MDALQRCLRLPEALVREIWQVHLSATERFRLQEAWRRDYWRTRRAAVTEAVQARSMDAKVSRASKHVSADAPSCVALTFFLFARLAKQKH